jgi:hypothetical protein
LYQIGAGLTRSDIASVLEAEKQVIADIIAEGGAANTELFNAFPVITGIFDTPNGSFEPSKHKVKINLHAGIIFRAAITGVKTKKITAVVTGTVVSGILDVKTGSLNSRPPPGRDVKVSGGQDSRR